MEVIQSFTIDHTRLKPGIYVSREDRGFTTYDLRITEPNKEPAMAPAAIHSLEHLMATWFRNSRVKDDVVYVGPMGCLTGMYIIMTGSYTVEDMRQLTIECLEWILTQQEGACHTSRGLRQLPASRPAHVPLGMSPLPGSSEERLPFRVHQTPDNAQRWQDLCRCLILRSCAATPSVRASSRNGRQRTGVCQSRDRLRDRRTWRQAPYWHTVPHSS